MRLLRALVERIRGRRRPVRTVDVGNYGRWELTPDGWRIRRGESVEPVEPTQIDRYREKGWM